MLHTSREELERKSLPPQETRFETERSHRLWLVHTMRWDLLFFQQFLDSTLYSKLHERQPFGAQIVSAVPFESEIQEPAQMASVFMGQNPLRNHRIQRAFLSQAV